MARTQQEASFTVKKTDFMKILKQLKTNVVNRSYRLRCTCEITLIDGYVSLNVPRATFGINAQTSGTAKASIELKTLTEIIKSHSLKELKFKIQRGRIVVEGFASKASTSFFEDDKILRSIILPMNFNDADLLAISASNKYTVEELRFNNLWISVNQAEGRLKNNIDEAVKRLKPYGITRQEIEQLVNKRIELNIQSVNQSYNFQKEVQGMKAKLFEPGRGSFYSEMKKYGANMVPRGCYYDPLDRYKKFRERLDDSIFAALEQVEQAILTNFSITNNDVSYNVSINREWQTNVNLDQIKRYADDVLIRCGDDPFEIHLIVKCRKQINPGAELNWDTVIDVHYIREEWCDETEYESNPVWLISIDDTTPTMDDPFSPITTTIDDPFSADDFEKIKTSIITKLKKDFNRHLK